MTDNSNHAAAGKSVMYQVGMGLIGMVVIFLVVGFIVRTVLTLNT